MNRLTRVINWLAESGENYYYTGYGWANPIATDIPKEVKHVTKYLNVTPAYGRDYKTAKAVKADWEAGKDFVITDVFSKWDGSYVNKDDAEAGTVIMVRYNNLRSITRIVMPGNKKGG